ncbi:hypothetical protein [Flavobacterium panacagri]|uniref:hypothetical protein n=1 Tax=Flavobacterium panacagri TaxID=3034146 RepID=UPI0025A64D26|nr:hypothetical protein [Flavobacterium panacagri]
MKKLLLLLLLICSTGSFAQKYYTITIKSESYLGNFRWWLEVKYNGEYRTEIQSEFTGSTIEETFEIPVASEYRFYILPNYGQGGVQYAEFDNYTLEDVVYAGGEAGFIAKEPYNNSPISGYITIKSGKPHMQIQASTTNICFGDEVRLTATPTGYSSSPQNDYPANAEYYWYYSLDGGQSWSNPNIEFSGLNTQFKIEKLIERDLERNPALNKGNILIKIGAKYSNTTEFNDNQPISIDYHHCSPEVTNIAYAAPLCTGGEIPNVVLTFNRNLESGEQLRYFQIKRVDVGLDPVTGLPQNIFVPYPSYGEGNPNNGLITSFQENTPNTFTYTISNLNGLENNAIYKVEYQAFKNDKNMAIVDSPASENFTFKDPAPLTFELEASNPVCYNGSGIVKITARGGSGEYYYYSLDGGQTKTRFTNTTTVTTSIVNGKTVETRSGFQQIELPTSSTSIHNITITDSNNCMEK